MKSFLKNIAFYASIILFYFIVTGVFNYNYDPYGILGNRKEFVGIRPNEHSLKVQHVLENKGAYNSFLFSNSKGGALHFNQLNTTGEQWYNMTYSLGTPEEFYNDLLRFLEHNIEIKNVVVALDDGAIFERTSAHENQASRKYINLEEKKLNWEYLFLPISFKKMKQIDTTKKHIVHDVFKDGNYYAKNAHPSNCALNKKPVLELNADEISPSENGFSSQIKVFKKIQSLCKEHSINLVFLAHPTSKENYLKSTNRLLQLNALIAVMKNEELPILVPYENYLLQNDDCFWLDRHHYSKRIGDFILGAYSEYKLKSRKI